MTFSSGRKKIGGGYATEHWLKRFMSRAMQLGSLDSEFEAIIIEISNLLRLYARVKRNLQVNALLKLYHSDFSQNQPRKRVSELIREHEDLVDTFTLADIANFDDGADNNQPVLAKAPTLTAIQKSKTPQRVSHDDVGGGTIAQFNLVRAAAAAVIEGTAAAAPISPPVHSSGHALRDNIS